MVNVVIPLFQGRDFICTALDSLVNQTCKDFIVTIVHDYDQENYDDIIEKYKTKLNIDYINCTENIYQGMARQKGIDAHPECDYVMFLDQDDEYAVCAIDVLYSKAKETGADIIETSYFYEHDNTVVLPSEIAPPITLHGKLYSTNYLRQYNIRFKAEPRYAEDIYFNILAFGQTDNVEKLQQYTTYFWKNNLLSQTNSPKIEFVIQANLDSLLVYLDATTQLITNEDIPIEKRKSLLLNLINIARNTYEVHYHFGYMDVIKSYLPLLKQFFTLSIVNQLMNDKDIQQNLITLSKEYIYITTYNIPPFYCTHTIFGILTIILNNTLQEVE